MVGRTKCWLLVVLVVSVFLQKLKNADKGMGKQAATKSYLLYYEVSDLKGETGNEVRAAAPTASRANSGENGVVIKHFSLTKNFLSFLNL